MSYKELASRFMINMHKLQKCSHSQQNIFDSMRGELIVLQYIADQGKAVYPGEISSAMSISSARIAAALNNLEKKDCITRAIDKNDRRQILVNITDKGRSLAGKHMQFIENMTIEILACLGEEDAAEYVRITEKLAARMAEKDNKEVKYVENSKETGR